MTYRAAAVKSMFNAIAKESFERAKVWFEQHPNEPYCYWSKDDFIAIKDKDNKAILDAHPEIEDIDDHTIVQWDPLSNTVFLSRFCPKLKQGIKALLDTGCHDGNVDGMRWSILPDVDNNNFKVLCYEDKKTV